jgi:peptidoglycan hydrolase CwlO-like protein
MKSAKESYIFAINEMQSQSDDRKQKIKALKQRIKELKQSIKSWEKEVKKIYN